jgi:hypothetical protein
MLTLADFGNVPLPVSRKSQDQSLKAPRQLKSCRSIRWLSDRLECCDDVGH